MANNEHMHSAGTALGYSTTGTGFTNITDLRKVKPPPLRREKSKDTCLDSASATDLFTGGWKSTGDASFSVYLYKTLFTALYAIFNTPCTPASVYYWQITFPKLSTEAVSGSTDVFQGVITDGTFNEASIDSNDKLFIDFTIAGSGVITWTSGS